MTTDTKTSKPLARTRASAAAGASKRAKPKAAKAKEAISRKRGHVRIEDVAKVAGVGAMTVSRALNQPHTVSAEKRKLVADAIRKTGYVPNLVAGSLASSRSKIIAVINPAMRTSIFSDMTQGMWDVLEKEDYQLLLGSTDYSQRREDKLIRTFISRRVDGLVLTGASHSKSSRRQLENNNITVIETFDLPADPIDMVVGFSAFEAAAEMARLAGAWGYKNPGIITAPKTTDNRTQRRIDGFISGLKDVKLRLKKKSVCEAQALTMKAGGAALEQLLAADPTIDIVLCTNDILAVGALLACQRNGWSSPERVAVTGFGDIEIADQLSPSLTTVRVRGYEMGQRIGELMLARLQGDVAQAHICDMGFEIIRRQSA
ncbi:MAG: LacI family DNA-binding transcriptional regulator [Pseudomonadota bacterium]